MNAGDEIILVMGALCVVAILAGQLSARVGTPLLLVFIGLGILAGEDGPGSIAFDDFGVAYLVGSLALAVILFEGGLSTERSMVRRAWGPATLLATAGVAISACVVGAAVVALFGVSWPEGLLLGAALAPTDAAAVAVLLRLGPVNVPPRVVAVLEVESGLNDPMSVFLTTTLIAVLAHPGAWSASGAAVLFVVATAGGAAAGLAGGWAMVWLFRRLRAEPALFPVLALGVVLLLFGGCQVLGASGFLAVYVAGVLVGNTAHPASAVPRFFNAMGWLAQIAMFLMLGLLVTPHKLPGAVVPALLVAAVLIVLARPLAVAACLLPFRWRPSEIAFISWVGLRGAVPIYLTIVALLEGVKEARTLFDVTFVAVIASVALQGWTLNQAARLLRLDRSPAGDPAEERWQNSGSVIGRGSVSVAQPDRAPDS